MINVSIRITNIQNALRQILVVFRHQAIIVFAWSFLYLYLYKIFIIIFVVIIELEIKKKPIHKK